MPAGSSSPGCVPANPVCSLRRQSDLARRWTLRRDGENLDITSPVIDTQEDRQYENTVSSCSAINGARIHLFAMIAARRSLTTFRAKKWLQTIRTPVAIPRSYVAYARLARCRCALHQYKPGS